MILKLYRWLETEQRFIDELESNSERNRLNIQTMKIQIKRKILNALSSALNEFRQAEYITLQQMTFLR